MLDPHGDLIDEMLELVPESREKDVILFDPMDIERPFGLNLLECDRNDPSPGTLGDIERDGYTGALVFLLLGTFVRACAS